MNNTIHLVNRMRTLEQDHGYDSWPAVQMTEISDLCDIADELILFKKSIKQAWDVAYEAPDLNMDNFNVDDVTKLNNAMQALFSILNELHS